MTIQKSLILLLAFGLSLTGIAGPEQPSKDPFKNKQERVYAGQGIDALQAELGRRIDGDDAGLAPPQDGQPGFFSRLLTNTQEFLSDHSTLLQGLTAAALMTQGCDDLFLQLLFLREAHASRFDLPVDQAPLVLARPRTAQPVQISIALTPQERDQLRRGSLRELRQLSDVVDQVRAELLSILERVQAATTPEELSDLMKQFDEALQRNYWRGGFIIDALHTSLAGDPSFETIKSNTTLFIAVAIELVETMAEEAHERIVKDSGSLLLAPLATPTPTPKPTPPPTASKRPAEPDEEARKRSMQTPSTDDVDALVKAASWGGPVEALLKRGLNPNAAATASTLRGTTPLYGAAFWGQTNIVKLLLKNGADPTLPVKVIEQHSEVQAASSLQTPLDTAKERGHNEIVAILEEAIKQRTKANPDEEARKRSTQSQRIWYKPKLAESASLGYAVWVRDLLQRGADPNAVLTYGSTKGETPLHCAARSGRTAIVKLLLEKGADPTLPSTSTYYYSQTPLDAAIKHGYQDIVALLVEAIQRRAEASRISPLSSSSSASSSVLVPPAQADSAKRPAEPDEEARKRSVQTPSTADVNALVQAVEAGDLRAIEELLARGVDANACMTGSFGRVWTALTMAAHCGAIEVVKLLLARGADPNKSDSWHITALSYSAASGNTAVMKLLLDSGADPNAASGPIPTPLWYAAVSGHVAAVNLLLDNGAEPNAALEVAKERGRNDIVAMIEAAIQRRAEATRISPLSSSSSASSGVTAPSTQSNSAERPTRSNEETRKRSMQPRSTVDVNALVKAAGTGNYAIVEALLKSGVDANAYATAGSQRGKTPLIAALEAKKDLVMRLLLAHGADPNTVLSGGLGMGITPLHMAILHFDLATLDLLLDKGADPNAASRGLTPLCLAARWGRTAIVKSLIDKGADPILKSEGPSKETPLDAARAFGNLNIIAIIEDAIQRRAEASRISPLSSISSASSSVLVPPAQPDSAKRPTTSTRSAETPEEFRKRRMQERSDAVEIALAAESGDYTKVAELLNRGVDANHPSDIRAFRDVTPLLIAVGSHRVRIVKLLLDNGAYPNAVSTDISRGTPSTPLESAAYWGDAEIVKLLLDNGAYPNAISNIATGTALHWAVRMGYYPIVKLLLDNGADPRLPMGESHDRRTPLDFAKEQGRNDIVAMLEEAIQRRAEASRISPLSSSPSASSSVPAPPAQPPLPRIIISDRYLSEESLPELTGFANNRNLDWLRSPALTLSRLGNTEQPPNVYEDAVVTLGVYQGRYLRHNPTTRNVQRFTYVFPGRMDEARIPAESEGGVVILIVPKQDYEQARKWVSAYVDVFVVDHIEGVDDDQLGLIASRRLVALQLAKEIGADFILLDDNLEHFYLDNGNACQSWAQLYNQIAQTARQNGLHYLSARTFRPEIDSVAPAGSLAVDEGEIGSKLAFITRELFELHPDVRTLVPHRMDIWGEDIWRQLVLKKDARIKIGVMKRSTLLFTRARALPGAAARSVISADTWLSETAPEGPFFEHADVIEQMQRIVRDNIDHRQAERNRIAMANLAQITQLRNGVSRADADRSGALRPLSAEELYHEALLRHLSHAIARLVNTGNTSLMAHQIVALRNLGARLDQSNYTGYFDMATGTGKTWLFLSIAALAMQNQVYMEGRNIAIVVPTIDLVDQIYTQIQNFNRRVGNDLRIDLNKVIKVSTFDVKQKALQLNEKVNTHGGSLIIVCADSLAAFIKEKENTSKPASELFSLFLIDEMHRIGENLVPLLADMSARTKRSVTLGFSATPGKHKHHLAQSPVFNYSTEDGIAGGQLCDWQMRSLESNYSVDALHAQLEFLPHLFKLSVREGVTYKDASGIIWVPSIEWANKFADMLKMNGIAAEAVHSSQPGNKNKETLQQFHDGRIKVLVAVDMLTLGFDAKIDYAVILRKIRNWDTWVQMRGRLLRRHGDPDKVATLWTFNDTIPKEQEQPTNTSPLQPSDADVDMMESGGADEVN